ncbi:MAG: hypothetical protein K2X55_07360 [Burkholderiaceae bacterium]|nr:hypothetical protein [Burkholderiaceae bacterium]
MSNALVPCALVVNADMANHRPTNIFFICDSFLLLILDASRAALLPLSNSLAIGRLLIRANQVVVLVTLGSLTIRAVALIFNAVRQPTSCGRPVPTVSATTRDGLAHAQFRGDCAGDLWLLR